MQQVNESTPPSTIHTEKGPNMGDHLNIYRLIARESAPAFSSPLNWYANGKRGHLHLSSSCGKLRSHGVLTFGIDLRTALTDRTVCTECLGYGQLSSEQRETVNLFRSVHDIARRSEAGVSRLTVTRPAIDAARNHLYRTVFLTQISQLHNRCGVDSWIAGIAAGIKDATPEHPDRGKLTEECLQLAAPHVLERIFNETPFDPVLWGGDKVIGTLGHDLQRIGYGHQRSPLAFFAKVWFEKLREGLTPHQANALLLENGDIVDLMASPDKDQLERCGIVLERIDGETLWQFTERNWKFQILDALRSVAAAMTARYEALVAPAPHVVIGNRTHSVDALRRQIVGDNVEHVVAGLQELVGNSERCLAICHPTVASLLHGDGRYGPWTEIIRTPIPLSADVLETAVALWEPRDRYSAYEKLSAAIEAAKVL